MKIQTVDERVREAAREQFKARIDEAFKPLEKLIHNTCAVKGFKLDGKDVRDKIMLEKLKEHIVSTQSLQHEENAVQDFLAALEEMRQGKEATFSFLE